MTHVDNTVYVSAEYKLKIHISIFLYVYSIVIVINITHPNPVSGVSPNDVFNR